MTDDRREKQPDTGESEIVISDSPANETPTETRERQLSELPSKPEPDDEDG